MTSCMEIIMPCLWSITIFNFADISKIFTNTIKVIFLEINFKDAIQYNFKSCLIILNVNNFRNFK